MSSNPSIIDISSKKTIFRRAKATGVLVVPPKALEIALSGTTSKEISGNLRRSLLLWQ